MVVGTLPPNRRRWGGAGTVVDEVSPPQIRKVVYFAGKVRFRWVETVPRVNSFSVGSTKRISLRVCNGPPTNLPLSLFVKLAWNHCNASSVWGSSKQRRWGMRIQATEAMVGAAPRLRKRVRATPDKKVRPWEVMVHVPSSDAAVTWMTLVSRWWRRVEESPVICDTNYSYKLPRKVSLVVNAIFKCSE